MTLSRSILSAGFALAAGLSLAAARPAQAQTDQSSHTAPNQAISFSVVTSYGQSFTPTLSSLNFVDLLFGTNGAAVTGSVQILAGDGFGGTVLGTSDVTTFADSGTFPFTPFQPTLFTFDAPVSLTPGSVYTIVTQSSGVGYRILANHTNPYAGGVAYTAAGVQSGSDFYFDEGIAAVPEASTTVSFGLLLILGMGGMVFAAKKKKSVSQAS